MTQNLATHRVGVFAVVRDDQGRALISRRTDNGYYNLPGGGLEPAESVTEGLIREILEETGLRCEITRLVGVYSKPQKHEIVLVFEATLVGGELVLTDEADDHRWITREQIDSYELLPKHRERLLDAWRADVAAVIKDQREASVKSLTGR